MKIELLAPVGSMECVSAAIENGCDAIYLGGRLFNARAFAGNFDNAHMEEVVDRCHLAGVKVYVTVNTLYKDSEFQQLMEFVGELYEMGVDGLIVQDSGAIDLIRHNWPDFHVHGSTQLTSNSLQDVLYWKEKGLTTVVLSRELSLKEIKNICDNSGVRIEVFGHGALCVCYSGQCLASSMIGNRSGNRGRCAQPCRMAYKMDDGNEGYLMSPKDVCTLDVLPDLIEAGVASLKLEGRMKGPEYVAAVTSIYRKYIDMYYDNPKGYHVDAKDRNILLQAFNREGFSSGYLKAHSGLDMMGIHRQKKAGLAIGTVISYGNGLLKIKVNDEVKAGDGIEVYSTPEHYGCFISQNAAKNEVITLKVKGNFKKGQLVYRTYDKKLNDQLVNSYAKQTRKETIHGKVELHVGLPAKLTFWDNHLNRVSVEGEIVGAAENQPVRQQRISQQIGKLGDTPFRLDQLEIEMDDNIYTPISQLNHLRSDVADKLREKVVHSYKRVSNCELSEKTTDSDIQPVTLSVLVRNEEQLKAAIYQKTEIIYFENCDIEPYRAQAKENGCQLWQALPRIYRDYMETEIVQADGYLVSNIAQLCQLKGKPVVGNFSFNVMNSHSAAYWSTQMDRITYSYETTLQQIKAMGIGNGEAIVYGNVPLMVTHQCPIGNYSGNKKNHIYCAKRNSISTMKMVNQNRDEFIVVPECKNCVCTIYGTKKLSMLNHMNEMLESGVKCIRIQLLDENYNQSKQIIAAFQNSFLPLNKGKMEINEYTGHYFREID